MIRALLPGGLEPLEADDDLLCRLGRVAEDDGCLRAGRRRAQMELNERRERNLRCPQLHGAADGRIEHPGRNGDDLAGTDHDMGDPPTRALLDILASNAPAEMRMPVGMDDKLLPDMGRMTSRWRLQGRTLFCATDDGVVHWPCWQVRSIATHERRRSAHPNARSTRSPAIMTAPTSQHPGSARSNEPRQPLSAKGTWGI